MGVYTMVAERENYFQCLQLNPIKEPAFGTSVPCVLRRGQGSS